jgi:hypothetical protein
LEAIEDAPDDDDGFEDKQRRKQPMFIKAKPSFSAVSNQIQKIHLVT